ncbi:hypothetical protein HDU98_012112 [Podochytrium sp. JEL0797]|nr:hypothetical protein HDU98_012112 [Podochytrium sp. JEL0797]
MPDAANSESVGEDFNKTSYTVKTILQSGQEQPFSDHLTQFIAKKEDEIEKMCSFHYQEFVQSVEQLVKVSLGTAHLKTKIMTLNLELQEAGTTIIEKHFVEFNANEELDVFDVATEHIDIKPLFKCIHIHAVLGKRAKFTEQLEGHRRTQADLLFESSFQLNCDDLKGFAIYLQDAVGFFIVEAIVVEGLRGCQNPEAFFKIKQNLSSYVQTVEGYGYAVEKLKALILSLFDRSLDFSEPAS